LQNILNSFIHQIGSPTPYLWILSFESLYTNIQRILCTLL